MTTINGCFMRHASLGQGGTRPRATCCILFSAIKPSIKLDPSLFTNFSNAHESRRHLTPPPLSVRRLCLRPRRSWWRRETARRRPSPSFACGYRLLDCALTDRARASVDASIRLGYLQRMIRITARVKRQFVLESLQSVQSKLSRFVLQISEDARKVSKQN